MALTVIPVGSRSRGAGSVPPVPAAGRALAPISSANWRSLSRAPGSWLANLVMRWRASTTRTRVRILGNMQHAPWSPPLVEMSGGQVGHLLEWRQHERDGSWHAWVSWVQTTGDPPRHRHKVVEVRGSQSARSKHRRPTPASRAGSSARTGRSGRGRRRAAKRPASRNQRDGAVTG